MSRKEAFMKRVIYLRHAIVRHAKSDHYGAREPLVRVKGTDWSGRVRSVGATGG